jgi:hypothetical protein
MREPLPLSVPIFNIEDRFPSSAESQKRKDEMIESLVLAEEGIQQYVGKTAERNN